MAASLYCLPVRLTRDIPTWLYKLAIVAATVVWGGSFTVMKGALDAVAPGWLLALRFASSAMIMALLFARRLMAHLDRRHLVAGVAIGLTFGLAYLTQNIGLTDTTPGKNAFLTATYCVMVPFMTAAVDRRRPAPHNLIAALACVGGVGLLSLGGGGDTAFSLTFGDALTLVGAVFFAINIVQLGRLGEGLDIVTVTVLQMAVCALVCLGWALCVEPPPQGDAFTADFWAQMAYVVLLSTVFATMAQNVAQQHVEPAQAALLLSLESVFGAIFSVVFYGEHVTPTLTIGFALIFVAILVSEMVGEGRETKEVPVGRSITR